jgi:hypothetical protein
VFAAFLFAILMLDLMFGKKRSSSDGGDFGVFDFGDGDGGDCGD